jgi:hypothetical protein
MIAVRIALALAAAAALSPVAENVAAGLKTRRYVLSAEQFNRGLLREPLEVTLSPIAQPEALLPSGTFRVELKNASDAPARIVDQLQAGLSRQIAENDKRLRVSPQADVVVAATITEWTQRRRNGTKYVSERRQTGTRRVTDKNGNVTFQPVYEYGHNEPSVINDGTISIRLEVRHVATEARLADLTARVTYFDETLAKASPPSAERVEDGMMDKALSDAAGKLSPGRQSARVLMARSDEVEPFNVLARERKWRELAAALQPMKPHRDGKRDAYRLHNLGVAHEAMAYEATDRATIRAELQEAENLLNQAVFLKKDEKYFVEAAQRVAVSLRAVNWISERETALAAQFPVKPPARTATARPAAATPATMAAASPTKERMTNADVIELKQAGLDDKLLIATIREAGAVSFDLGPAALRALLGAKVSNPVISAMREKAKSGPKPQH